MTRSYSKKTSLKCPQRWQEGHCMKSTALTDMTFLIGQMSVNLHKKILTWRLLLHDIISEGFFYLPHQQYQILLTFAYPVNITSMSTKSTLLIPSTELKDKKKKKMFWILKSKSCPWSPRVRGLSSESKVNSFMAGDTYIRLVYCIHKPLWFLLEEVSHYCL